MPKRLPAICYLPDGRAYVRVKNAGKRKKIYLGTDDAEIAAAYERFKQDWITQQECPVESHKLTVDELCLRFMQYAEGYYRKNGKTTSEVGCLRSALKPLVRLFGATPVAAFGPKRLRDVRDLMVEKGWARKTVNDHVCRIRQVIKWAIAEELAAPSVLVALQTLPPLRQGRTKAAESKKKKPVSVRDLIATCRELSPLVRSMVIVQARTAMRPSELLSMTLEQIDRSGPVWIYKPASHKTEHHGKEREILIGRKAQRHILRWVIANQQAAIFRSDRPNVGDPYGVDGYRNAICRAAKRAGISESPERRWSPARLRHTGSSMVTKWADMETARVICGQSNIGVTERHYAEVDRSKAMRVMAKFG